MFKTQDGLDWHMLFHTVGLGFLLPADSGAKIFVAVTQLT
jgi:hypothetical protein